MKLSRDNKFFKWGLTAFLVIVAGVVFWIIFSNLPGFYGVIQDFVKIISSVLYGCLFAYLMNPMMEFTRRHLNHLLDRTKLSKKRAAAVSKGIGIVVALLVFLGALYALIALVVPNIINSLQELLQPARLEGYYNTIAGWIHSIFPGTAAEEWLSGGLDSLWDSLQNMLGKIDFTAMLSQIFSAGVTIISTVFHLGLGIIAAVYILIYKKQLCVQAKKLTVSMFRADHADRILEVARRTNRIFGGYVIGKILDAIFVGVVTYLALIIMGMPFAPLIATLVGVTNVIPYFGPFLGGVPSALLLLVENPIDMVYFVIFIVILQMIDGNIIENRIMGVQLGISDFWVLVAILVFGGIFGFPGMLLGVPVFAVIYSLISDAVHRRLKKKNISSDPDAFYTMQCVADLPAAQPPSVSYVSDDPGYDLNVETEEEPDENDQGGGD